MLVPSILLCVTGTTGQALGIEVDRVFVGLQATASTWDPPGTLAVEVRESHPDSINAAAVQGPAVIEARIERGWMRITAFASAGATYRDSLAFSQTPSPFQDVRHAEHMTISVPCRPDLDTVLVRIRAPTISVTGAATGSNPALVGRFGASASLELSLAGNYWFRSAVWTFGEPAGSSDLDPPALMKVNANEPLLFYARALVGASAESAGADGETSSSSAVLEYRWEGIEAVYDMEGTPIPCFECSFGCLPVVPPLTCPGDANNDGMTDAADLSVLLASFGTMTAPYYSANFNGDGFVNGADLSILLANFGCDVTP